MLYVFPLTAEGDADAVGCHGGGLLSGALLDDQLMCLNLTDG